MGKQTVVDTLGTGLQQAGDILDCRVVRDAEEGGSPYSGLGEVVSDEEWL
jgi:hypothetical protein